MRLEPTITLPRLMADIVSLLSALCSLLSALCSLLSALCSERHYQSLSSLSQAFERFVFLISSYLRFDTHHTPCTTQNTKRTRTLREQVALQRVALLKCWNRSLCWTWRYLVASKKKTKTKQNTHNTTK